MNDVPWLTDLKCHKCDETATTIARERTGAQWLGRALVLCDSCFERLGTWIGWSLDQDDIEAPSGEP